MSGSINIMSASIVNIMLSLTISLSLPNIIGIGPINITPPVLASTLPLSIFNIIDINISIDPKKISNNPISNINIIP